ncbi:hypothetical protein ACH9L7_00730 [Haloferax sp. S1W]|uniref:hypothetical protein n=1 Tax=Haloferax sp. S1W TaxID=3377110 RepID=UPI0037C573B5
MQTDSMGLEADVLEVLERRGPLHVTEVALAVDSHLFSVEACCARLVAAGELRTESCGVYELTRDDTADDSVE